MLGSDFITWVPFQIAGIQITSISLEDREQVLFPFCMM